MAHFRIAKIGAHAFSILDEEDDSFYVIEGDERAAVIDTGITRGQKIMPVVRELTQKPVVLIVTHAHIDHFHHIDEFDTVYLCRDELKLSERFLQSMMAGKNFDLSLTQNIETGSIIDLGGDFLEICQVGGHTPGSIAVLEKNENLLFTGDAIGSGYGVWMQPPGALPLSEYYNNLVHFMKWLVEHGGRMKFYGGHNRQQFQSTLILNYNPLNMGLLADLVDLVDKVIKGEIVGRESNADKSFDMTPTLYASFGRAELQYNPLNI